MGVDDASSDPMDSSDVDMDGNGNGNAAAGIAGRQEAEVVEQSKEDEGTLAISAMMQAASLTPSPCKPCTACSGDYGELDLLNCQFFHINMVLFTSQSLLSFRILQTCQLCCLRSHCLLTAFLPILRRILLVIPSVKSNYRIYFLH